MFATNEELQSGRIGIGDEVFITGLFSKAAGRQSNLPIIRIGNIAMMPTEKIPGIEISGQYYESEVYLLEARSLGGLSGSPVFVSPTIPVDASDVLTISSPDPSIPMRLVARHKHYFFGLMNGHWKVRPSEINEVEFVSRAGDDRESVATGISVVVPAQKIFEIINQPLLVEQRERLRQQLDAAWGGTTSEVM